MADFKLKLSDNLTFERLAAQMQVNTNSILAVEDGTTLRIFTQSTIPKTLVFEHKQKRELLTEYYFRDSVSGNLLCFFGYDNAVLIKSDLEPEDFEVKVAEDQKEILVEEDKVKQEVDDKTKQEHNNDQSEQSVIVLPLTTDINTTEISISL